MADDASTDSEDGVPEQSGALPSTLHAALADALRDAPSAAEAAGIARAVVAAAARTAHERRVRDTVERWIARDVPRAATASAGASGGAGGGAPAATRTHAENDVLGLLPRLKTERQAQELRGFTSLLRVLAAAQHSVETPKHDAHEAAVAIELDGAHVLAASVQAGFANGTHWARGQVAYSVAGDGDTDRHTDALRDDGDDKAAWRGLLAGRPMMRWLRSDAMDTGPGDVEADPQCLVLDLLLALREEVTTASSSGDDLTDEQYLHWLGLCLGLLRQPHTFANGVTKIWCDMDLRDGVESAGDDDVDDDDDDDDDEDGNGSGSGGLIIDDSELQEAEAAASGMGAGAAMGIAASTSSGAGAGAGGAADAGATGGAGAGAPAPAREAVTRKAPAVASASPAKRRRVALISVPPEQRPPPEVAARFSSPLSRPPAGR